MRYTKMAEAKLCNIDGRWVILLPEGSRSDVIELSVRRQGTEWVMHSTAAHDAGPVAATDLVDGAPAEDWAWLPGLVRELDADVLAEVASINQPEPLNPKPSANLDLL